MLIELPEVLKPDQLRLLAELLAGAEFQDGRLSAGASARRVKANQELPADSNRLERLNQVLMPSLLAHPLYGLAALPLRVAAPYYVRYEAGMRYGAHIDDPVMNPQAPYRSDIAITVFLNEPSDYQGGELVIETHFGERSVKLPAGNAILYPASSVHRVNEVTAGRRLAAITWVQSLVRHPDQRAILFDLARARQRLLAEQPDEETTRQVDHAYVNLVRRWAET